MKPSGLFVLFILIFSSGRAMADVATSDVIATVGSAAVTYSQVHIDPPAVAAADALSYSNPNADEDAPSDPARADEELRLKQWILSLVSARVRQKLGVGVTDDDLSQVVRAETSGLGDLDWAVHQIHDQAQQTAACLSGCEAVYDRGEDPDSAFETYVRGKAPRSMWDSLLPAVRLKSQRDDLARQIDENLSLTVASLTDPGKYRNVALSRNTQIAVLRRLAATNAAVKAFVATIKPPTGITDVLPIMPARVRRAYDAWWRAEYASAQIVVLDPRFQDIYSQLAIPAPAGSRPRAIPAGAFPHVEPGPRPSSPPSLARRGDGAGDTGSAPLPTRLTDTGRGDEKAAPASVVVVPAASALAASPSAPTSMPAPRSPADVQVLWLEQVASPANPRGQFAAIRPADDRDAFRFKNAQDGLLVRQPAEILDDFRAIASQKRRQRSRIRFAVPPAFAPAASGAQTLFLNADQANAANRLVREMADYQTLMDLSPAVLLRSDISGASVDQVSESSAGVNLELTSDGCVKYEAFTQRHIGAVVAVMVNHKMITATTIHAPNTGYEVGLAKRFPGLDQASDFAAYVNGHY